MCSGGALGRMAACIYYLSLVVITDPTDGLMVPRVENFGINAPGGKFECPRDLHWGSPPVHVPLVRILSRWGHADLDEQSMSSCQLNCRVETPLVFGLKIIVTRVKPDGADYSGHCYAEKMEIPIC
jgi:hypothetical protein